MLDASTQAAFRAYCRAVDDGKMEPSVEAEQGFMSGWNGVIAWRSAQRTRNEASGYAPLSMLLYTFGAVILALLVTMWFTLPHSAIRPQSWIVVPVSITMLVAGWAASREARRRYSVRAAAYADEWEEEADIA